MKTNRYFVIAVVAVLIPAAVWIVAEAGVKSEPSVKNNESVKQNAEYPYLTPEDYENFYRIVKKSRIVSRNQVNILKGLGAVRVLVEELTPMAEQLGLTRQALQTDVELLLRKYGIEIEKNPKTRNLYITVSVMRNEIGVISFKISVEFSDIVILVRNPEIITSASVWQTGGYGTVGRDNFKEIRATVEDFVKIFINDYLAANPGTIGVTS